MAVAAEIEVRSYPRGERRKAGVDIAVRELGQTRMGARVIDVSLEGCKVETNSPLRTGTQVWVTLPGLRPQAARVVWSRGYTAGCRFALPLHPAVFETLLPHS